MYEADALVVSQSLPMGSVHSNPCLYPIRTEVKLGRYTAVTAVPVIEEQI